MAAANNEVNTIHRVLRKFGCTENDSNQAHVGEAKLNKKHLGICYHAVREASAAKIWQVGFIKGEYNVADCLTKILSGTQLDKHISKWMYRK